jgi:Flp pilus assembly protein TadG
VRHGAGRRRDERGASALELAFIAPAFLLLIFFTVQGALYFYGRNVAIQAAREGVSQLRLAQDQSMYDSLKGKAISRTEDFADEVGRGGLNGAVAKPGYNGTTGRASMTVTGTTITLVPLLDLKVTATADGPVEKFRGDQ